ncbi:hypothetical protein [Klebsiella michiganensis]|uniref:hypothetical protein n=1 Tax=Klebsiella michiganensis TaxID=1134687 RepID=UPI000A2E9E90|nr:hypothetical protein [Klebsiella michiganensis]MCD6624100.1 hypothetical protein [Klebsiella michiganensis]OSY96372.1 hypothetical protein BM280_03035 [Klebsiella michiganensis]WBN05256.1 hypothetical protein KHV91_20135 [Klebsiella michiganensis]HED1428337.1 hypothetical protein [Klebsiella michiganensis]HED2928134.1 hypothetical protein [Klebsiella michiganensis]
MNRTLLAITLVLFPFVVNAQFTIGMYKEFKVKAKSPDTYVSDYYNNMINMYLTGAAIGAQEALNFADIKNSLNSDYKKPFCLPAGTTINSDFAKYIIESLLSDNSVSKNDFDNTGLGRAYVIGVSRYFPCK